MNRRAVFTTLLSNRHSLLPKITSVHSGLEPYDGAWAFEQAAHLLRRATFGPTYTLIKESVNLGRAATVDQLLTDLDQPPPPINLNFQDDPFVEVGETWINAPYDNVINLRFYRSLSLRSWTMGLIHQEGISAREKMTLFWHNHFSVNGALSDPKYFYRYIALLRQYAWGNFRELVKAVTIDPAMLRFLNGNQNRKNAPNENYARELLELFTIGKGPQVGPGDYTNFTEADISAMAKILTGWGERGYNSTNPDIELETFFNPNQHDTNDKQLSARFDNIVVSDMGDQEYAHLIDIIFQKEEVARFICRKLYRWFVYYEISEQAEADVIEPMAQLLIASDYDIKPVLSALLNSAHFFDALNIGPMIKNPIDFVMSAMKQLEVSLPGNLNQKATAWYKLFSSALLMQMEYYNPPDVAGWKAYYQEPSFYRIWINATTLIHRMGFTDTICTEGFDIGNEPIKVNGLETLELLDNPSDPNAVIEELSALLFPQPLADVQKTALKGILIPGLPDYEWTVEYGLYLSNPNDLDLAVSINSRMVQLIQAMLSLPEFYLS
ncbi:MAG TPA: DUF1800 domain-containing protein [Saprospiraceae bacterium]|nr:DUF1800 domain-containing protein [Saprospiraceae bacterium]HMQ85078.1 DUF1800 domain-containing protein [Saprospiraceae bacterium]